MYNEKYIRDEDEIDARIRSKYYAGMKEAQGKSQQMTQKIRNNDLDLNNAMNKLVWGGKANLTHGVNNNGKSAVADNEKDDENDDNNKENDKTNARKPKQKRKKQKRKERKEEKKVQVIEDPNDNNKALLVVQSVAAGITIGAAAVFAAVVVDSSRKSK